MELSVNIRKRSIYVEAFKASFSAKISKKGIKYEESKYLYMIASEAEILHIKNICTMLELNLIKKAANHLR